MDADLNDVWTLAASGDKEALIALRDRAVVLSLEEAIGEGEGDELLATAQVFAQLASMGGDHAAIMELASVYILRAMRLERRGDGLALRAGDCYDACDVAQGDMLADLARREYDRSEEFLCSAEELYPTIIRGPLGIATKLVESLTFAADGGSDRCATILQQLIEGVPRERALALTSALKEMEKVEQ